MTVIYAILSGFSAALASVFGKASGFEYHNLDIVSKYATKVYCLIFMIALNGVMWIFYVKALQSSKSSIEATIVITATNYVTSGLFGYLIYQEVTGFFWWCGITLILLGVGLIVQSSENKDKLK